MQSISEISFTRT